MRGFIFQTQFVSRPWPKKLILPTICFFRVFDALNQVVKHIGEGTLDKYRELKVWYDKTADRARIRMYMDHRKTYKL